jgi:sec-independent protein translocase protein TatC
MEHLHELRRRLFFIAISVIAWSAAAYAIQQRIVNVLLKPSHGQSFVYTSPIGGIDFLFRVCLYTGLIFSIPFIV